MPISWGSWVEENFYFDFFRKKANFYHFSPDITAQCIFYSLLSLFLIRPIYADSENLISANKSPYLLIFCLKMIKYPIFKGKIRFWYFIHPPISWKSSIYRFSDNPGHNILRILLRDRSKFMGERGREIWNRHLKISHDPVLLGPTNYAWPRSQKLKMSHEPVMLTPPNEWWPRSDNMKMRHDPIYTTASVTRWELFLCDLWAFMRCAMT